MMKTTITIVINLSVVVFLAVMVIIWRASHKEPSVWPIYGGGS